LALKKRETGKKRDELKGKWGVRKKGENIGNVSTAWRRLGRGVGKETPPPIRNGKIRRQKESEIPPIRRRSR